MTRRKNCFGKKQKELKSKRKKKYSDDSGFDVSLFDRRKKNGNIKFIFINFERYLILCTISFFFLLCLAQKCVECVLVCLMMIITGDSPMLFFPFVLIRRLHCVYTFQSKTSKKNVQ